MDSARPHYAQNAAQEIRENRGTLNRVRRSWTRRTIGSKKSGTSTSLS
jgi:hypothetical protein